MKAQSEDSETIEHSIYPSVPTVYGPSTVRGLKKGEQKLWCTCGLSKKQPWCDGSHIGTPFKPLKWTVPKDQSIHAICSCKYTKSPPYCDGTHVNLPEEVIRRKTNCCRTHCSSKKLCSSCGWIPDF
ncbi:DgyrCDS2305 [Dimorphilus gyrociliatus]|uniref:DgyrCDS2305 n=1 Tax=Dimorphilus gyrociliatus TaxID=2664684 RepID=A0A7I8VCN8_9ANNE|nr:DgyrCDS2305 [Dimorphilus gyrociliatus]